MLILSSDAHVAVCLFMYVLICLFIITILLLIKIFNFVVNAADNKQRDKNMTCIKVSIDP